MSFILAQVAPEPEAIISFVLISLAYLLLCALVLKWAQSGARLIALGLVTAVAAAGYGSLVLPGGPVVAPTLVRIAFLLVLAGIVVQLLCGVCNPTPPPTEPREGTLP